MIEKIDRTIHEPSRLLLMIYLFSVEKADFTFLKTQTGMTQGNLSSHLNKLESAGYIRLDKTYRQKRPATLVSITGDGRRSFTNYVRAMHHYFSDLMQLVK
jgi:DNA-binding MarR family transcriptional regulator